MHSKSLMIYEFAPFYLDMPRFILFCPAFTVMQCFSIFLIDFLSFPIFLICCLALICPLSCCFSLFSQFFGFFRFSSLFIVFWRYLRCFTLSYAVLPSFFLFFLVLTYFSLFSPTLPYVLYFTFLPCLLYHALPASTQLCCIRICLSVFFSWRSTLKLGSVAGPVRMGG